ncbi:uncharacterized protein LOC129575112 [Sitodiplosis mosellana]|uniref:uncharacterized protein LOC129575112 n=1 Tax=Sitodiplosis mosellana TaxID=263140 RepID=UPI002444E47F|nr:uncharacterized protein LOC129575112 [Sitodiplosis mosellana]
MPQVKQEPQTQGSTSSSTQNGQNSDAYLKLLDDLKLEKMKILARMLTNPDQRVADVWRKRLTQVGEIQKEIHYSDLLVDYKEEKKQILKYLLKLSPSEEITRKHWMDRLKVVDNRIKSLLEEF